MNKDSLFGCVGKFTLHSGYISRYPFDVMRIMSKMIVIRAEFMFHSNSFEYTAYSELFEFKADGFEQPFYEVEIVDGEVIAERLLR